METAQKQHSTMHAFAGLSRDQLLDVVAVFARQQLAVQDVERALAEASVGARPAPSTAECARLADVLATRGSIPECLAGTCDPMRDSLDAERYRAMRGAIFGSRPAVADYLGKPDVDAETEQAFDLIVSEAIGCEQRAEVDQ